jgi:hypothetical protein
MFPALGFQLNKLTRGNEIGSILWLGNVANDVNGRIVFNSCVVFDVNGKKEFVVFSTVEGAGQHIEV